MNWHLTFLLAPLLAIVSASGADSKPNQQEAVTADPKATAEWLTSIFAVKDGRITIASKTSDDYRNARLKFAGPTDIRLHGSRIIADQTHMYPVMIGPFDGDYVVSMYTPFYDFLEPIIEPDGLPGYAPHPKLELMTTAGFRQIAEIMHTHLSRIAGGVPEHHRVLDEILYPSEHYIWTVGKEFIILTAYEGNDSDGIYLRITSKTEDIEGLRQRPPTKMDIFKDWGEPLPHQAPVKH